MPGVRVLLRPRHAVVTYEADEWHQLESVPCKCKSKRLAENIAWAMQVFEIGQDLAMLSQSSQDQTQAMDEGTPEKHMSTGAGAGRQ